ncbi:DDE_3 domain-containing protein [Trichonephila clavipes]|nr:DDE_3 domain-containing protein [Trichonephila clavipes]
MCKANFPDISSEEWPPYTPDLNSMDYRLWSILESQAFTKAHKTLDSLKQSLLREGVKDLKPTVENFCKCLRLCIAANSCHFETK